MHQSHSDLADIIARFHIEGRLVALKQTNEGHINDTFFSTFDEQGTVRRYTHQRINHFVFKNPPQVMENIHLVTSHIQAKLAQTYDDYSKRCLVIVPTKDEGLFHRDEAGNFWRTYRYIDGVKTIPRVENVNQAYLLGKAVGTFQTQLADFDGSLLHQTIADFHDMRVRYDQLKEALTLDRFNRANDVRPGWSTLIKTEARYVLVDGFKSGQLPFG